MFFFFFFFFCKGTADNFYKQGQLLPENFVAAAREVDKDEKQINVREQEGYDHSYYFVGFSLPRYNTNLLIIMDNLDINFCA
jgi:S-formylglutathione hydrolase FrmB